MQYSLKKNHVHNWKRLQSLWHRSTSSPLDHAFLHLSSSWGNTRLRAHIMADWDSHLLIKQFQPPIFHPGILDTQRFHLQGIWEKLLICLKKWPQISNASQIFTKELYHDQKFHWRLGLFLQLFTLLSHLFLEVCEKDLGPGDITLKRTILEFSPEN